MAVRPCPAVTNMKIDYLNSVVSESEEAEYQFIVEKAMEYMSPSDFKVLRLLSTGFEEIFKKSQSLKSFQFKVDGKSSLFGFGMRYNDPLQTLTESSVPWPTIIFKNLDLETKLMSNQNFFDGFMKNNCQTLKNLHLESCQLNFLRFVELLAWMESLESLTIVSCPKFFDQSHTFINFEFLIPDFLTTLSQLRSFTLKGGGLRIPTIQFFLSETPKLCSLNLGSKCALFPDGLIQTIALVKDTLRVLTLSGRFYLDKDGIDTLGEFNLKFLSLDGFVISNSARFATRFLQKQLDLRKLFFKNMALDFHLFLQIHLHTRLMSLLISDCKVLSNAHSFQTLINFNRVTTLQEIFIKCVDDAKDVDEIGVLFEYPRPALLKTRLIGDQITISGNILESLSKNCQNLQILEIHQAQLVNTDLQWVWKLQGLKKLVMRTCSLSNFALSSPCINFSSKSLCDLSELRHLDLSYNYIGDETIRKQILNMNHLHKIVLRGTMITNGGLQAIAVDRQSKLPNLTSVEFYECHWCEYTYDAARDLEIKMAPVNLYFEGAINWSTPGSPFSKK